MRTAFNRQRWAVDQRKRARAAFVPPDPVEKLSQLRELAATLETMPHMSDTLAAVKAEIIRLSK